MRTFTQFLTRCSYAPKRLPLILAVMLISFSALLAPTNTEAQVCTPNSFQISGTESGFFDRNNERWTYIFFFVKNTNQNAISHMTFTLPSSGGCAPGYLGNSETGWARGQYSLTKPTTPITNSLTMEYGQDNSCSVTGQADVLKINKGEIDKEDGMWVRLELKGTWTFDSDATINFKYGNACCTQALGISGGGSGFFGCYWDCALQVTANYSNILCFGGTTTVTAVVTGAAENPPVQYRIDAGQWQTSNIFPGVLAGQHTIDVKQGPCEGTYTFTINQPGSAVGLSLEPTDVLCFGTSTGSITATGSGGTPPYEYKIEGGTYSTNNVFGGLAAGTYTVYVKDDNDCETASQATITQPDAAIDLTLTPTNVLCYGAQTGSIKALGSGGTGNYQYKLEGGVYSSNDEFTGLGTGSYTVYVKDENECETAKQTTITQPDAAINLSLTPTNVLCYGALTGSIKAEGSGGTGDYQYKLEGGVYSSTDEFTGLGAGTYTVYVKDKNGCETAKQTTITQPGAAIDLTLTPTNVLCYGAQTGSIKAAGSGGTGDFQYKLEAGVYAAETEFTGLGAGTYTVYVKDQNGCETSKQTTITQPGAAIDLTLTPTNVLCYGAQTGSIKAEGSGGTGDYQYKLEGGVYSSNNEFTGLGAGTYTVYIKDQNGCETAKQTTITQPDAALNLTLTPTPVLCNGAQTGSIKAAGSGGTGDYQYKLEGGVYSAVDEFTGLGAGAYTVYVKDQNGCETAKQTTITQPGAAIDLTLTPTAVLCYGTQTGSIKAAGSGGTGDYQYKLEGGVYAAETEFTGFGAGTYTVYVKDQNGCETSKQTTITQPDAALDLTLTPTPVLCNGAQTGSIKAAGSGGTGNYQYKLEGGVYSAVDEFTGLGAGTYTVYVKDENECETSKQITILQPGSAIDLSLSQNDVTCFGANTGSITASGSGGTGTLLYKLEGGELTESNVFNNLTAGTYTVYVVDANGCGTSRQATIVEPGTPVTLTLTPTPANCFGDKTGSIKAEGSGGTGDYEFKLEGGAYSDVNEFTGLGAGTYTVYVKDENGCETFKQVTIAQPEAALSLVLTPTDILCNGATTGSIKAVASGGTPTYLYQLEDGGFASTDEFGGLPASTFTVYVKDLNGCETFKMVEIKEPPVLELLLTPTDVLCKGYESGSITAQGSGGTGTLEYKLEGGTYSDKTLFENLVAGTYTVFVRDVNGCETSQQTVIKEPATIVTAEAKADKEKVCTDEKTNVTITASGGTPPYKYKYDNGAFGDIYIFSLGAGTHNFTVQDYNGCEAITSVIIVSEVCGNFCTYTQGYFGNNEGLSTNPDGGGKASYKDGENCITSRVNNTIQFALGSGSLPSHVGNIPTGDLSADVIINYLPGGGSSGLYTGIKLPASSYKNTLLAQLLTLALNMGLNPDLADFIMPASGELWTQRASDCGTGSTTSACKKYSFSNGKGMTIGEIYSAASAALTNSAASNSVRSNWANTLDAINRGFDECARVCEPDQIVDPSMLLTDLVASQRPTAIEANRNLKVKAYPNPFTDRIYINFTSPVGGKAVVEIFDMSGRRIAEINKGQVNAYVENRIEYIVPISARSAIIYKVSVGNYSITGRMIAPTR